MKQWYLKIVKWIANRGVKREPGIEIRNGEPRAVWITEVRSGEQTHKFSQPQPAMYDKQTGTVSVSLELYDQWGQ